MDAARAVAILWMLFSHFVTVSLVDEARDVADPVYLGYAQLRSYTAPLFLTVSGVVFTYFLCSSERSLLLNPRVRRGLRRAVILLGVGYATNLNLRLMVQEPEAVASALVQVGVLHVVAVGLLSMLLAFALHRVASPLPLSMLLLALGVATFVATPLVAAQELGRWPEAISSYLFDSSRTRFALFPSLGYIFFGGACGALIHRFGSARPAAVPRRGVAVRRLLLPTLLMGAGLLLHQRATFGVFRLYHACGAAPVCALLPPTHVWLGRAGAVVAFIGLLMALEPLIRRRMPDAALHAGQQTLTLFVLHAVLLYGVGVGYGLDRLIGHALSPAAAVAGGLLFAAAHVTLAHWRAAKSRLTAVGVAHPTAMGCAPAVCLHDWEEETLGAQDDADRHRLDPGHPGAGQARHAPWLRIRGVRGTRAGG